MMRYFLNKRYFFIAIGFALAAFLVFGSAGYPAHISLASTRDNVSGYAWSENIGWISFNCTNTNSCAASDYGVRINENNGNVNGYAWSEHVGWISFEPDGPYPSFPDFSANLNFDTNEIRGWARACAVFAAGCNGALKPDSERGGWDGWISMAGANYGVNRNSTGGAQCPIENYAWGGDVIGWIHFGGAGYGVSTSLCSTPPRAVVGFTVPGDAANLAGQGVFDASGNRVGTIQFDADGNLVLVDSSGRVLGTITVDSSGALVLVDSATGSIIGILTRDTNGNLVLRTTQELQNAVNAAEAALQPAEQNVLDAQARVAAAQEALAAAQASGEEEAIAAASAELAAAQTALVGATAAWETAKTNLENAEAALALATGIEGPVSVNTCTSPLQPTLLWTFADPDRNAQQSAYQVQIATRSNFQSQFIIIDSGKTLSDFSFYTVPPNTLSFNATYYWRVRVWDNNDLVSEWAEGPTYISPAHAYPAPSFSFSPQNPTIGGITRFFDQSTSAEGTTINVWRWRFADAIPGVSYVQNPETVFQSAGVKPVSLRITDSDNLGCSTDQTLPRDIRIISPVEFREI